MAASIVSERGSFRVEPTDDGLAVHISDVLLTHPVGSEDPIAIDAGVIEGQLQRRCFLAKANADGLTGPNGPAIDYEWDQAQSSEFCSQYRQFRMDLALFDFDGTITSRDTFRPFLSFAGGRARMALGTALLGPMVVGYELGCVPASRMRAAAAYLCCRGRPERELREIGARYGRTLTRWFRPEALERIRWHKERGDTVVVVSASLRPYLEDVCRGLQLELVCTELEARGGVLTGRYLGGDCTGPEKARRVRAAHDLARYSTIHAYGDTREDAELLELASRRYYRWRELPAEGGVQRERLGTRPTR